jgi:hypothetical protein
MARVWILLCWLVTFTIILLNFLVQSSLATRPVVPGRQVLSELFAGQAHALGSLAGYTIMLIAIGGILAAISRPKIAKHRRFNWCILIAMLLSVGGHIVK